MTYLKAPLRFEALGGFCESAFPGEQGGGVLILSQSARLPPPVTGGRWGVSAVADRLGIAGGTR
jgi:hypothetical protein